MNVLVGKSKKEADRTRAKLVSFERQGDAELEKWEVNLQEVLYTFSCYDDRRSQLIRAGSSFGSVETKQGELFVWKDEG